MEQMIAIIRRIAQIEAVGPDTNLGEAGLTSMNVVELLVELESAYGVTVPDEAFLAAKTPRELFALISPLQDMVLTGVQVGEMLLA
jgi:acyl carrier protein